eukprot:gene4374-4688_t
MSANLEIDELLLNVFTSISLHQTTHLRSTDQSQGIVTKTFLLKDKKYGLFLIITNGDRDINAKLIATKLNLSGANLRFADEQLVTEKLSVSRDTVTPFALINDKAKEIKVYIDKSLLQADQLSVAALKSDHISSLASSEFVRFLEYIDHKPIEIDFDQSVVQDLKTTKLEEEDSNAKNTKKESTLGLTVTREEDFSTWYTQTITLSEMIDYSDISGCYILRPWAFFIWESIQTWMDAKIKAMGVQNAYFPLFLTQRNLNTEKEHVKGFAPEVAWVTKSGQSELSEAIAIRPTSEAIMYPIFSKWIRSHRDLPMQVNQWCNVVRWEFKDATPFLRSREFLWQEGHTVHRTYEEAQERVLSALDLYAQVYEDLLAVPVIKGMKTESERFAGGLHTTTVEAYINGSGRAIQGATSHNLGQNFGNMFKIQYEDENGSKAIPWQTSWGLTTRTIGVAVMVHGDDKGLVLPPRVAPIQVIICPIANKAIDFKELVRYCDDIRLELKKIGIRVDVDDRQNYTAGWKFNHSELKGVPIRLEVGFKDYSNRQCRLVRRDNGEKTDIALEGIGHAVHTLLDNIHHALFQKAKEGRDEKIVEVREWKDFVPNLERKCLVLTPFCDIAEWEEKVKKMSKEEALRGAIESATSAMSVAAKTLCKPFDQPPLTEETKCFVSGLPARTWVLWGRSY